MRDRRCSRCGLVNKNGCAELLFCGGVVQAHSWEPLSQGEFSIGGDVWPGLSKLIEEAGEMLQVCGKLLGTRGSSLHFDGSNQRLKLQEELADTAAAIIFVSEENDLDEDWIQKRVEEKLALYREWKSKGQ